MIWLSRDGYAARNSTFLMIKRRVGGKVRLYFWIEGRKGFVMRARAGRRGREGVRYEGIGEWEFGNSSASSLKAVLCWVRLCPISSYDYIMVRGSAPASTSLICNERRIY